MAEEISILIRAKDEASRVLKAVLPSLTGISEGSKTAGAGMAKLGSDAKHASDAVGKATGVFSGLGKAVDTLGKIGLAGMGLQMLGSAAKGAGDMLGIGLNVELENTKAQLMAFTKDGAKASAILEQIRSEAAKTPFAFQEMAAATAGLMPAAKQSGAALMDLVRQAEILAASNPAEGLKGAAFALREAVSGDFTSVIERFNLPRTAINKLKDEGVPALEIVRRAMLAVGYDADLVSNLANTASGRWSTLLDTFDGLRATLSAPMFAALSAGLSQLQGELDANGTALTEAATAIGTFAGKMLVEGVAGAKALLPVLGMTKDTLIALATGSGFDLLYANMVKTFGKETAGNIAKMLDPLARLRSDVLPALATALIPIAKGFADLAGQIVKDIPDAVEAGTKKLDELVKRAQETRKGLDDNKGAQAAIGIGLGAASVVPMTIAVGALMTRAQAAIGVIASLASKVYALGESLYIASMYGGNFGTALAGSAAPAVGLGFALSGVGLILVALATDMGGFRTNIINIRAEIDRLGQALDETHPAWARFKDNIASTAMLALRATPGIGQMIRALDDMAGAADRARVAAASVDLPSRSGAAGIVGEAGRVAAQQLDDNLEPASRRSAAGIVAVQGAAVAAAAALSGGGGGGGGGLSGAAEKAKTAIEELGISAGTFRKAAEMAEFGAATIKSMLITLGVEAIDAGQEINGLGITAEKLTLAFRRAGLSADAAAAAVARVQAEVAKKAAWDALGVSLSTVRQSMDLLKMSSDEQATILIALGESAIKAGPLLDGLSVTVAQLAGAFDKAGQNGAVLAAQVAATIEAAKATALAEEAEKKAKTAAEELARAQKDFSKEVESSSKAAADLTGNLKWLNDADLKVAEAVLAARRAFMDKAIAVRDDAAALAVLKDGLSDTNQALSEQARLAAEAAAAYRTLRGELDISTGMSNREDAQKARQDQATAWQKALEKEGADQRKAQKDADDALDRKVEAWKKEAQIFADFQKKNADAVAKDAKYLADLEYYADQRKWDAKEAGERALAGKVLKIWEENVGRLNATFASLTSEGQAAVAAAGGIQNVLKGPMHYENGVLVPGAAAFGPGTPLGFARGGTVPGSRGTPQLATVHGGEVVATPGDMGTVTALLSAILAATQTGGNVYIDGQTAGRVIGGHIMDEGTTAARFGVRR